ncbi:MAG: hypothetical protein JW806_05675 [Sedimentisphaerales bacterium]|nr:hypothetical protein [Sedimentisphaerales bacterium]
MDNKRITVCLALLISICFGFCAEARITSYSAPWCGFCRRLERYLAEQNVDFKRVNVDRSQAAKRDMQEKSGQNGIPVLDWEGEIIVGFGRDQKEEIDRLIAGGTPIKGKFVPGRNVQPENDSEKTEEINHEKALYDFVYNHAKDLDILFANAEKNVYDIYAAEILEKLYDAHMAKIVYESTFTDQFEKRIEQTSTDSGRDDIKLIGKIKNIAGNRYAMLFENYRTARSRNLRAGIQAQQALKLAINKKQNGEKYNGYRSKNARGYLLRIWACAAVNPKTGIRLRPNYTEKMDLENDALAAQAAEILDELTAIQHQINEVEDANTPASSD